MDLLFNKTTLLIDLRATLYWLPWSHSHPSPPSAPASSTPSSSSSPSAFPLPKTYPSPATTATSTTSRSSAENPPLGVPASSGLFTSRPLRPVVFAAPLATDSLRLFLRTLDAACLARVTDALRHTPLDGCAVLNYEAERHFVWEGSGGAGTGDGRGEGEERGETNGIVGSGTGIGTGPDTSPGAGTASMVGMVGIPLDGRGMGSGLRVVVRERAQKWRRGKGEERAKPAAGQPAGNSVDSGPEEGGSGSGGEKDVSSSSSSREGKGGGTSSPKRRSGGRGDKTSRHNAPDDDEGEDDDDADDNSNNNNNNNKGKCDENVFSSLLLPPIGEPTDFLRAQLDMMAKRGWRDCVRVRLAVEIDARSAGRRLLHWDGMGEWRGGVTRS